MDRLFKLGLSPHVQDNAGQFPVLAPISSLWPLGVEEMRTSRRHELLRLTGCRQEVAQLDRLLKLLALGSTCRITQVGFPVLAPRFLLALAALAVEEMRTSPTPEPLRLGLRRMMEPLRLTGCRQEVAQLDRLLKLLGLGSTCRITQVEFPVLAPRFLLAPAALGAGGMRTSQTPGPLRLGLRRMTEPLRLTGCRQEVAQLDRLLKLLALGSTCRITQDGFPVLAPRFLLALAALGVEEMRTSQTPEPLRLGLRRMMEPLRLTGCRQEVKRSWTGCLQGAGPGVHVQDNAGRVPSPSAQVSSGSGGSGSRGNEDFTSARTSAAWSSPHDGPSEADRMSAGVAQLDRLPNQPFGSTCRITQGRPLLHAAVNQKLLSASLQIIATAGHFMCRTQKCKFHAPRPFRTKTGDL